jgi:hypothetical protein
VPEGDRIRPRSVEEIEAATSPSGIILSPIFLLVSQAKDKNYEPGLLVSQEQSWDSWPSMRFELSKNSSAVEKFVLLLMIDSSK